MANPIRGLRKLFLYTQPGGNSHLEVTRYPATLGHAETAACHGLNGVVRIHVIPGMLGIHGGAWDAGNTWDKWGA